MLDAGTTVAILMLLFAATVAAGLLIPDARELVSVRLAGWADAAFSALLVALGAAVERVRSRGRERPEEALPSPDPSPRDPRDGSDEGAA